MSDPIRIICNSVADVEPAGVLAERARAGRHAVLIFPTALSPEEEAVLIGRLSMSLPDHSVFDSGADPTMSQVTILPVVARARIWDRRDQVVRAIEEYRRACRALVQRYRSGNLPTEWKGTEHGGHVMFENLRTGQIVEAPFREWVNPDRVDPYFFAVFVRSTAGLETVAELISHDFHDGARILDVVAPSRTQHGS